jgi:hypothetical protein
MAMPQDDWDRLTAINEVLAADDRREAIGRPRT